MRAVLLAGSAARHSIGVLAQALLVAAIIGALAFGAATLAGVAPRWRRKGLRGEGRRDQLVRLGRRALDDAARGRLIVALWEFLHGRLFDEGSRAVGVRSVRCQLDDRPVWRSGRRGIDLG